MERNLKKVLFLGIAISFGIGLRVLAEWVYQLIFREYELTSFTGLSLRLLFAVIFVFVWLAITFRIEEPRNKLPWLLFLFIDPILGMTLFLSLGRSFRMSLRYRKRLLKEAGFYGNLKPVDESTLHQISDQFLRPLDMASRQNRLPIYKDSTEVKIIFNGENFFPELFEKIKKATSSIWIEVYILRFDQTGQRFLKLLDEKAKEGLEVKLLIDGMGSAGLIAFHQRRLKKLSFEWHINDRVYFPLFNTRITYRNHRKMFIIDGQEAYLGGMNIGDEYDNSIPYYTFFKDTMIHLNGLSVEAIQSIYAKDYYYITGKPLAINDHPQRIASHSLTQIVESGPDQLSPDIHDLYQGLMARAKSSIQIMTPYLALDDEILSAIRIAIKEGVKVDIIVPGVPDKYMVYMVTKYYIGVLLEMGANIHVYEKGFLHSKMLVIDEILASVGSYNLDNRSARIDFEITAICIHDNVKDLVNDFKNTLEDSKTLDKATYLKRPIVYRFIEHTLSLFSSLV
jgi:cardiolipin synthase A/B